MPQALHSGGMCPRVNLEVVPVSVPDHSPLLLWQLCQDLGHAQPNIHALYRRFRRRVRYKVGERVWSTVICQGSVKADCTLERVKPGLFGVLSRGGQKFSPQTVKQIDRKSVV